jgi:hypothetical protein
MREDAQNQNRGGAMLLACKLYARTSGGGAPYLMGRLGGMLLAEAPQREGDR